MPEECVGRRRGEVEIKWSDEVPTKRRGKRDRARRERGKRARTNHKQARRRQEGTERRENGS
jgi:hypothetical protein